VIEKSSGKEYATKFIQVRDAVDKEFFRSELDMLLRQSGKGVVHVHDAYETPRQLIIVMELYPFNFDFSKIAYYRRHRAGL
jgi:hypothetical protein